MRKNHDLGPMEKTSKKKVIREGRGRVYNIKKGRKAITGNGTQEARLLPGNQLW